MLELESVSDSVSISLNLFSEALSSPTSLSINGLAARDSGCGACTRAADADGQVLPVCPVFLHTEHLFLCPTRPPLRIRPLRTLDVMSSSTSKNRSLSRSEFKIFALVLRRPSLFDREVVSS